MSTALTRTLDQVLATSVANAGGVPGVVAMATDRNGNFYEGAKGVRQLGEAQPMTLDTVVFLASCTKAIAGVALMQLVEEGKLKLEDEASRYVPDIAKLQVLTGFDTAGKPQTRPPVRAITVKHLMLHTSGLGYDFFYADDARYAEATGTPSILGCTYEGMQRVLLHDPGERWTYGANIDWLGLIVEKLRGKRLGEVLEERLFNPLGMVDIAFTMTPSMRSRLAPIHMRSQDGPMVAVPDLVMPQPPAMDMGGHGLYATTAEYLKFIRMILNDGNGPNGRVLKAETVEAMARNGLGSLKCSGWLSVAPPYTNSGDFFPGMPKSWGYSFQITEEDAPTGRRAGSLSWAGLTNNYYWIDRKSGLGGMWNTQILPFMDIASYPSFIDFETAVYRHQRA